MSFFVINQMHRDPVVMRRIITQVAATMLHKMTLSEQGLVKMDMLTGATENAISNLLERRANVPSVIDATKEADDAAFRLDEAMRVFDRNPSQAAMVELSELYTDWHMEMLDMSMAYLEPLIGVITGGQSKDLITMFTHQLESK